LQDLDTFDLAPYEIQVELDRVNRELPKTETSSDALSAKISLYETRLNPPADLAQELQQSTRAYDAAKQRYTILSDRRLSSGDGFEGGFERKQRDVQGD